MCRATQKVTKVFRLPNSLSFLSNLLETFLIEKAVVVAFVLDKYQLNYFYELLKKTFDICKNATKCRSLVNFGMFFVLTVD